MPSSPASFSASWRSTSVVVGERNSSVSDRMQESIAPLMLSGILSASGPIRSYMIVAVQATGRTVMLIGPFVFKPPCSMWWSITSVTRASLMLSGSSATLLVSTMMHSSSAVTSSSSSGRSKPQRRRTNNASVFGSPKRRASAGVPRHSERYHAQIRGDPVESVSGDLWPKTLTVIGWLSVRSRLFGRALYQWVWVVTWARLLGFDAWLQMNYEADVF